MKTEYWIDDYKLAGVNEHLHGEIKKKILERVSKIIPYVQNKKVLSLGCGSGFSEDIYSTVAEKVIGVDIDENAISYAKQRYKGIEFYCHDAGVVYPFLFNEKSFDVVVCTEVLEHMSKKHAEKIVDGIKHMLVKDGWFIGTVPVENDVGTDKFHKVHYTSDELKEWFGKYFSEVTVELLEHPHPQYFFGNSWLFKCKNG